VGLRAVYGDLGIMRFLPRRAKNALSDILVCHKASLADFG
jgi:hypothetical protein